MNKSSITNPGNRIVPIVSNVNCKITKHVLIKTLLAKLTPSNLTINNSPVNIKISIVMQTSLELKHIDQYNITHATTDLRL